jgi:hypothetical protein
MEAEDHGRKFCTAPRHAQARVAACGATRARHPRRSTLAVARIGTDADNDEGVMSKGMNQKKNEKKAPAKTLKEKREAKAEKKKK